MLATLSIWTQTTANGIETREYSPGKRFEAEQIENAKLSCVDESVNSHTKGSVIIFQDDFNNGDPKKGSGMLGEFTWGRVFPLPPDEEGGITEEDGMLVMREGGENSQAKIKTAVVQTGKPSETFNFFARQLTFSAKLDVSVEGKEQGTVKDWANVVRFTLAGEAMEGFQSADALILQIPAASGNKLTLAYKVNKPVASAAGEVFLIGSGATGYEELPGKITGFDLTLDATTYKLVVHHKGKSSPKIFTGKHAIPLSEWGDGSGNTTMIFEAQRFAPAGVSVIARWDQLTVTSNTRAEVNKNASVTFKPDSEWKPVDMNDLVIKEGSALDLSGITEQGPAGKHGRVIIGSGGNLAFEDAPSRPVRFQGFNGMWKSLGQFDQLSGKDQHKYLALFAELIKRQGYNVVRPLAMEGYIMKGSLADCKPNLEKIDLFDRFIYELKQRGIYTYLTIGAYNLGFKDSEYAFRMIDEFKTRMFLGDEELRSKWKTMAGILMNHINPYTGIAWKDDPAIICVEFFNEQEIGFYRARGTNNELKMLNEKWEQWIRSKYKTPQALSISWNIQVSSWKEAQPYLSFDDRTWNGMDTKSIDLRAFRDEAARELISWYETVIRQLGYKGLTSQYNVGKQISLSSIRWESSPVISMNGYFNHPTGFFNVGSTLRPNSSIGSEASYWLGINSTCLSDRPFIVTEHNHSFWNPYVHEDGLLFAAYSALQDFSGILVHTDPVTWKIDSQMDCFYVASSPVMRANEFLACCLFQRGDVQPAKHNVMLQIPQPFIVEGNNGNQGVNTEQAKIGLITGFSVSFSGLKKSSDVSSVLSASMIKPDLTLQPGMGATIESGEWSVDTRESGSYSFSLPILVDNLKKGNIIPADNLSDPTNGIFQSETGEILLRSRENLMKVETGKTEAVSLEAGKSENIGSLNVLGSTAPATIAVTSVDGSPLASSSRIVLVYSTEVANTGMELSPDRVTLLKQGTLPVLMKTGKLDITLKNSNGWNMSLYALGLDGSRREKIPVQFANGLLKIDINTADLKNGPTPFFELAVK